MLAICPSASVCSGCNQWGVPHADQLQAKCDHVRKAWHELSLPKLPEIQVNAPKDRGLRDRLDFQWSEGRLGLFDHDRRQIVDLPECYQLSEPLQAWLTKFRRFRWPLSRATFRLRVSFNGDRGVWIDASNEEIKNLLQQSLMLRDLLTLADVEMGQRRKALILDESGQLKLAKTPRFRPWMRTWAGDQPVPLYSRIADFSQAGDLINRHLVNSLTTLIPDVESAVDWGCGSGNLTFPLAERANKVFAVDYDDKAIAGLRTTLAQSNSPLARRIVPRSGTFELKDLGELAMAPLWVIDPPRGGAGTLLETIPPAVRRVILLSCYTPTFLRDGQRLAVNRFEPRSLTLVDQFPQKIGRAHV